MKNAGLSKLTLALSIVAVVLSAAVSLFGMELWLAGTQWMLVSILCAVWSLALKE